MSATKERTANDLRNEAQALVQRRNELGEQHRALTNTKTEAITGGDARTLMTTEKGLLEIGPAIVEVCAELDARLDDFKTAVEAEFVRDHKIAEARIIPIREKLATLRQEMADLEQLEQLETQKAAPEVDRVVTIKREAESWHADQKAASRAAILRIHG